jgi:cytoskeletal protein CcmA (bactofilin family)
MNDPTQSVAGTGERSYLGKGSTITGELQFPGTVELPGYVKGRVEAATIIIEASGQIEGELRAANIMIRGRFDGTLIGGTVTLQSSARVTGEISYGSLRIDNGAEVEVVCRHDRSGNGQGPTEPLGHTRMACKDFG